MTSGPIHMRGSRSLRRVAVQPPADFYPLLWRQLLDGFFDFGERAHGGNGIRVSIARQVSGCPGGYDYFLEKTGALDDERAAIMAG